MVAARPGLGERYAPSSTDDDAGPSVNMAQTFPMLGELLFRSVGLAAEWPLPSCSLRPCSRQPPRPGLEPVSPSAAIPVDQKARGEKPEYRTVTCRALDKGHKNTKSRRRRKRQPQRTRNAERIWVASSPACEAAGSSSDAQDEKQTHDSQLYVWASHRRLPLRSADETTSPHGSLHDLCDSVVLQFRALVSFLHVLRVSAFCRSAALVRISAEIAVLSQMIGGIRRHGADVGGGSRKPQAAGICKIVRSHSGLNLSLCARRPEEMNGPPVLIRNAQTRPEAPRARTRSPRRHTWRETSMASSFPHFMR